MAWRLFAKVAAQRRNYGAGTLRRTVSFSQTREAAPYMLGLNRREHDRAILEARPQQFAHDAQHRAARLRRETAHAFHVLIKPTQFLVDGCCNDRSRCDHAQRT